MVSYAEIASLLLAMMYINKKGPIWGPSYLTFNYDQV